MPTWLLNILSIFARTPQDKADLALGEIGLKYIGWIKAYFATPAGAADVAVVEAFLAAHGGSLTRDPTTKEVTGVVIPPQQHQSPQDFNQWVADHPNE